MRFDRRRFVGSCLVALAVCIGGIPLTGPFAAQAQMACTQSPEGQVLVVSNNVFEAERSDARRPKDMRRFVTRMKDMVPFSPDIVLVQEVRARAVGSIKKQLRKKFGCTFSIAANAGTTPWKWTKKYTHLLGRDTAVLVNKESMRVRRSGHIVTSYKRSEAAPGASIKAKRAAWALVKEKNDPDQSEKRLRVVAASVHFPRGSDFKNSATSERVKKRSAKKIANKLEKILHDGTAQDAKMHVIAGDFNSHRYSGSPSNEMPPYHLLTHEPYSFTDGVIEHATGGNPNPIDFIFSTGKSLEADVDSANPHDPSSPNFYSNHDLRWSLLAPY